MYKTETKEVNRVEIPAEAGKRSEGKQSRKSYR